jgi:hypothetical protein
MKLFTKSWAVLLTLMLLAAACGGDTTSETTSTTAANANDNSAAPPTTTEDVAPETTEPPDSGDTDAGDFSGLLTSNECLDAATAIASAFSGGFSASGFGDWDEIAAGFDRMSDAAPAEIRDDLALMADALGEFFSILEDSGADLNDPTAMADPALQAALQEASEKIDTEEYEEAADSVDQWFEEQCAAYSG